MQNEALRTVQVYRPFNKKIFYKDSALHNGNNCGNGLWNRFIHPYIL